MPDSPNSRIHLSDDERLFLRTAYEWQFEGRRGAMWNGLQGEDRHPLDCYGLDPNSWPPFLGNFHFGEPEIINPIPAYLVKAELHGRIKDRDPDGVLLSLESDGLIRLPELRVYHGGTWQLRDGRLLCAKLTTKHRGKSDSSGPNAHMKIHRMVDQDRSSIPVQEDVPYHSVNVSVFGSGPTETVAFRGEVVYEYSEWPMFQTPLAIEVTQLGLAVVKSAKGGEVTGDLPAEGEVGTDKPKAEDESDQDFLYRHGTYTSVYRLPEDEYPRLKALHVIVLSRMQRDPAYRERCNKIRALLRYNNLLRKTERAKAGEARTAAQEQHTGATDEPKPKKVVKRRRREQRTVPTEKQNEAYALYLRLGTYRAVAEQLAISPEAARQRVGAARKILDNKSRSVKAHKIPLDHRAQESVSHNDTIDR